MLNALDVIRIHDDLISPPGPKMVVCVEALLGYFFRINSRGHRPGSLLLKKAGAHEFLDHDSHLECGGPLELDDYIIDESLRRHGGTIGCVSPTLIPAILQAMDANGELSPKDKAAIRAFLAPLMSALPQSPGIGGDAPGGSETV